MVKKGERLAGAVKETADRMRKRKQGRRAPPSVPPHRHCAVCNVPIALESDPPVCDDADCVEKRAKQEKARSRLTVMLYLFPAIAILLVFLQAMSIGS